MTTRIPAVSISSLSISHTITIRKTYGVCDGSSNGGGDGGSGGGGDNGGNSTSNRVLALCVCIIISFLLGALSVSIIA